MKIALLLRGFHYIEKDRFGFPLDGRMLAPGLRQQLLEPLRREHEVQLFAVTYASPIQEEFVALLRPDHLTLLESRGSSQVGTFQRGLDDIEQSARGPFDRIIATRFDLAFLKPVTEWAIWRETGIYFPWREYEHFWLDHHRVGDAVHVVDRDAVPAFREGLRALEPEPTLHFLYRVLENGPTPLHFIEEGFYDSNTLFANRECTNPLYCIGNRAKINFHRPVASPWMRNLKQRLPPRLWGTLTKIATRVLRRG